MHAPPDQTAFWNQAARTRQFTHPLDHVRFTVTVSPSTAIFDYGCGQGLSGSCWTLGIRRCWESIPRPRWALRRAPTAPAHVSRPATASGRPVPMPARCGAAVRGAHLHSRRRGPEKTAGRIQTHPRARRSITVERLSVAGRRSNLERYRRFAEELSCYGRFRIAEGSRCCGTIGASGSGSCSRASPSSMRRKSMD